MKRPVFALLAAVMALPACGGGTVPAPQMLGSEQAARPGLALPADTTSILKELKKDVTIGSTVDPKNGDTGPRAITVVRNNYAKLKKGHVLVCNFSDSKGTAGAGTTIEQIAPVPGSKPSTFIADSNIKGCDGDALTDATQQLFATGLSSKVMVWVNQDGKAEKTYGKPITDPIGDGAAAPLYLYSPEYMFIGNADTGAIDDIGFGGSSGQPGQLLEVVKGFNVNKGAGWKAEGPSGLAYWCGGIQVTGFCKNHSIDELFVADGACNAIVLIDHAASLLTKDEIVVKPGCKSFTCVHKTATCAKLLKAGSPLDAPVALTVMPNGNLIVANGANNTLVELTSSGKVLDTKVVDNSKTPAIFGVAAIGTSDSDTAVFYTDTNTNTLHELER